MDTVHGDHPNRPLSDAERDLARYMLTQAGPKAAHFLSQLDEAEVKPWRCPCGCASLHFRIEGHDEADAGMHVLGDFVCGPEDAPSGVFIFESGGLLGGIELYSSWATRRPRCRCPVSFVPSTTGEAPDKTYPANPGAGARMRCTPGQRAAFARERIHAAIVNARH